MKAKLRCRSTRCCKGQEGLTDRLCHSQDMDLSNQSKLFQLRAVTRDRYTNAKEKTQWESWDDNEVYMKYLWTITSVIGKSSAGLKLARVVRDTCLLSTWSADQSLLMARARNQPIRGRCISEGVRRWVHILLTSHSVIISSLPIGFYPAVHPLQLMV